MADPRPSPLATLAALALLYLLLVLPAYPVALALPTLLDVPLELPAMVLVLAAAPVALVPALRAVVVLFAVGMAGLKLADLGAQTALRRPFNPVLDGELVAAGLRLLGGSIGWPGALSAAAALILAIAITAVGAWWATGRLARLAPAWRQPRLAAVALLATALVLVDASPRPVLDPPGSAATARLAREHLRDARAAQADLARFRAEADRDTVADLPPARILPVLRGTDVLVIFVESYGRSSLTNPLYAPTVGAALGETEARLAAAGLAMRSGFLTSPTVGGQSWLAHASLLSGLRIDNQGRYRALLASPRRTLLHLAQSAGWQTAAVMPAITLAWPEAGYFGYDRVLAAADLGYGGLPFNWVTMPDQFTLAVLERELLRPGPRPPIFAEVALISSHAPWTPIPPILPWEALGDGRVFDPYATAGDAPEVLWLDDDRVREQFRRSLDYVLRVVGSFAERQAAKPPLIVVLGDHEPAAFVSADPAGREVPVHVIGAPATIAEFDVWGWSEGMVPAPDLPAWPMEAFRDRFLAAFSAAPDLRATAMP